MNLRKRRPVRRTSVKYETQTSFEWYYPWYARFLRWIFQADYEQEINDFKSVLIDTVEGAAAHMQDHRSWVMQRKLDELGFTPHSNLNIQISAEGDPPAVVQPFDPSKPLWEVVPKKP